MSKYVLSLSTDEEVTIDRIGGKGLHLCHLARVGLPVPPGFVITTDAYRAALSFAKLLKHLDELVMALDPDTEAFEKRAAELQEAIGLHLLPGEVESAIRSAYAALGADIPVAVRSSAISEDLGEASFAGQYITRLGVVGSDAVVDAVRACWASLWNAPALAYRRRHDIPWTDVAMAVVVQAQFRAEVAGVLFTLNPLNGRESEMMVEACWGLGEAVVGGRVTPDRYVVDAIGRRVIHQGIVDKTLMIEAIPGGGTREQPVPPERRKSPTLTTEQLLELTSLGLTVQEEYGAPQDIEWALSEERFVLLQSRPLTAISFQPAEGQWTSANYREVMPGFVTPLSFSLTVAHDYTRSLQEFTERIRIARPGQQVTEARLFFGRVYWRIDRLKQLMQQIPGFVERRFDETAGIEPVYEGDGLVTPFTPRTIARGIPILLALEREYNTYWKEADAYCRRFQDVIEPELDTIDPSALSDAEIGQWVQRMIDLHWETNRVAMTSSYLSVQAQDDFHPALEKLNAELSPTDQIAEGDLITGLGGVETGEVTIALWELAQQARADEELARMISEAAPTDLSATLQSSEIGGAFWARFEGLIKRYRYMSASDEDLSVPRWDEDPTFALTTLRSLVLQGDAAPNPHRQLARQREVRQRAEERARAYLRRGWGRILPFRANTFFTQLKRVQQYAWWRERVREVLGRTYYHCRRFLVEQGRRWAGTGFIEEAGDIFLLEREPLLDALAGRLSSQEVKEIVRRYKQMRRLYRNFEPPGVLGLGAEVGLSHTSDPAAERWQGVACSSGVVKGPARLVRSLDEAGKVRQGDILVVPYTNPGWTPLFGLASGIVIEEGGLLSHGAVVAREYGLPAVLQVPGTRLFRDGELLLLDGGRGTVERVRR